MPAALEHELRVRWAECDPQGIVFNPHYLAYFDISLTELWRAAFGSYNAMLQRGIDLVLAEAQIRYRNSARFDDLVTLRIEVARLGQTSITSAHSVWREEDLLAEGTTRHVAVDAATLGKTPVPEWARTGLAPWTTGEAQAGS